MMKTMVAALVFDQQKFLSPARELYLAERTGFQCFDHVACRRIRCLDQGQVAESYQTNQSFAEIEEG